METPLFSIIIPTYNSELKIKECIESIIIQEFKDYEIIVMDNCSSDNTRSIISSFNEPRIYIISEPDNGIYDAMNKAILRSRGEWIYFLGSDDILYSEKTLQLIAEYILRNNIDFIYGNVILGKNNQIYRGKFNKSDIIEHNICHQAIFTRKTIIIEKGLFNPTYRICADNHMNIKLFGDKSVKKIYINYTIAKYADTGISSKNIDEIFIKQRPQIVKENFGILFYLFFYKIRPIIRKIEQKLHINF